MIIMHQFASGADPGIKKRGHSDTFFWTAASLESRASPKKADERGGGGGTFFLKVLKGGGHGPDVPPSKSATGLHACFPVKSSNSFIAKAPFKSPSRWKDLKPH